MDVDRLQTRAKPCPPHNVIGNWVDVGDSREFRKQTYDQWILQSAVCRQFRNYCGPAKHPSPTEPGKRGRQRGMKGNRKGGLGRETRREAGKEGEKSIMGIQNLHTHTLSTQWGHGYTRTKPVSHSGGKTSSWHLSRTKHCSGRSVSTSGLSPPPASVSSKAFFW